MTDTRFVRGMDLSMLKHLQDHGVQYKEAGTVCDPLDLFQRHGINYVRLRLFVNPDGTAGQVNTLAYTLALARRVKQAGLALLLDFHYSDEWADPLHQTLPAAWAGLSLAGLVQQIFTYTRDTLAAFEQEGCLPDMVQVGNEITDGMVWPAAGPLVEAASWNDIIPPMDWPEGGMDGEAKWDALAECVKAGIRGVKEIDSEGVIPIMIHVDKGGSRQMCQCFFDHFQRRGVPFDIIGLSFYPFWHGTLADLKDNLAFLGQTYQKDIIVVETGYDWTGAEQGTLPFPITPDGQKAFLQKVIQTVADAPNGLGRGVFYWAPEWITGAEWDGPDWLKTGKPGVI